MPGVYVIYADEHTLLYIGSTNNLRNRITSHFTRNPLFHGNWDRYVVKFRPVPKCGEWLMVEHRLITRLRPPLNIRGTIRSEARLVLSRFHRFHESLLPPNPPWMTSDPALVGGHRSKLSMQRRRASQDPQ